MAIEMIHLHNLLANMGLPQEDYTEVFEDNTACIEWSNHVLGGRERAKHIDIRKHFAHEAVQNGHIWLYQISTEYQLADLLTKPLYRPQPSVGIHRRKDFEGADGKIFSPAYAHRHILLARTPQRLGLGAPVTGNSA